MYFSNLCSCFPIFGLLEPLHSCFLNSFDTSRCLAFYSNKLIQVNFVHFLLRPEIHYFSKESYFFLKKIEFREYSLGECLALSLPSTQEISVAPPHPVLTKKHVSKHYQNSPGEQYQSLLSITILDTKYITFLFSQMHDIFVCLDHSFFHQCLLGRHFGLSQIFAVKYSTGVNSLVLLSFYIFAN